MLPLRTLHVTPYFAPAFVYGGPPRSILGLCKALRRIGVDVNVITTTANGSANELPSAIEEPREYEGVPARYFPLAPPRWLWNARGLEGALMRSIPQHDVIHIHGLWHMPAWLAAHYARQLGVPYVVSPRGMLEPEALAVNSRRKAIAFRLFERRNLECAALLHCTSTREVETLERRGFGPPLVLAPNGVDAAPRSDHNQPSPLAGLARDPEVILRALGIDPPASFVLFLGRLHPIKRLDLLAAAMTKLRTPGIELVIAGPDEGGHADVIRPLFDASGVKVTWTGAVDSDQKASLLMRARALVLCSDSESFGLTVAEAMSAGVPVVVTHTCPWSEVEREGAGRWVPQNPQAMASALDEIVSDPNLGREMGARGRALVARRYTWEAAAITLAQQYRHIARSSSRASSDSEAREPVPELVSQS
jgi:glycosyltransferase involved in cell wall biosynthesis